MEDLQAVLAGMPPGADLFDYLSALIDEQVRDRDGLLARYWL
jgi:hypothetical protein